MATATAAVVAAGAKAEAATLAGARGGGGGGGARGVSTGGVLLRLPQPPLDVAWMWFLHRCQPDAYSRDLDAACSPVRGGRGGMRVGVGAGGGGGGRG